MLVSVTMFQIAVFRLPLFFVLFLCEEKILSRKWKHWKYNYMLGAFLDSTEGLVSNISL